MLMLLNYFYNHITTTHPKLIEGYLLKLNLGAIWEDTDLRLYDLDTKILFLTLTL